MGVDNRIELRLQRRTVPWVALALPNVLGLPVILVAFAALYFADIWAVNHGVAPVWYPALRKPLTIIVVCSLLVAWLATLVVG